MKDLTFDNPLATLARQTVVSKKPILENYPICRQISATQKEYTLVTPGAATMVKKELTLETLSQAACRSRARKVFRKMNSRDTVASPRNPK